MNTKTQRSLNEVFNVDPIPDDALDPKKREIVPADEVSGDQIVPFDNSQIELEDQQI